MSTRVGPYDVTGTAAQVADIQAAVARCAYDLKGIGRVIPVKFSDLTSQGALGLFWTNGRIEVDSSLSGDEAQSVFLSESAHAVDQYVLTNADRIALQMVAHPAGPDGHSWFDNSSYYDELGETMMDVFVLAFTDLPPSGLRWTHPATPELVTALRGILTPTVVPPAPPVEPPPAPPVSSGAYVLGPPQPVATTSGYPQQLQDVTRDGVSEGTVKLTLYKGWLGKLCVRSSLRR